MGVDAGIERSSSKQQEVTVMPWMPPSRPAWPSARLKRGGALSTDAHGSSPEVSVMTPEVTVVKPAVRDVVGDASYLLVLQNAMGGAL